MPLLKVNVLFKPLCLVVGTFFGILLFAKWNEVSKKITNDDRFYTEKIMNSVRLDTFNIKNYRDEINLLKYVQQRVLQVAPKNKGIPLSRNREPKDLYLRKEGLCYDRSRVMEKILMQFGFETRHVAIYSEKDDNNEILPAYFQRGSLSHAISEVKTTRGWVFLDSNDFFIGIDDIGFPISTSTMYTNGFDEISWSDYNNSDYDVIYKKKFTFIYGLYSRHGYFYYPYNAFPDVNLREFKQNFF